MKFQEALQEYHMTAIDAANKYSQYRTIYLNGFQKAMVAELKTITAVQAYAESCALVSKHEYDLAKIAATVAFYQMISLLPNRHQNVDGESNEDF